MAVFLRLRVWTVGMFALILGSALAQTPSLALESDPGVKRTAQAVGGLSVLAPDTMTLVDESFARPAHLFDGFDRPTKVQYLLTLLKDPEWAKITTSGLSAYDLSGEARAVMDSILPQPFRWSQYRGGVRTGSGSITDGVRLKLVRGLSFLVNLAGQPKSYRILSSTEAKASDELRFEDDGSNPFGLQPLKVMANHPKLSELDYGLPTFDKAIELPHSATIAELIDRVSRVTGTEIHCDFRAGSRRVVCGGTSCRAGDLLQGLALCVTGTFRRLGPAFELTSDIEGLGARDVRFAIWEANQMAHLASQESDWRQAIGKSGHLAQIGFPPGSPLLPNAAMQSWMSRPDHASGAEMMPTTDMNDWSREFLQSQGPGVDSSKAGVQAEFECVFVLPDGRELRPEPWLLTPAAYAPLEPVMAERVAEQPPYSMSSLCSDSSARSAIVQAPDAASARWQLDLLKRFGFQDVWMEATRPEVLLAASAQALKDGLRLRLLVRPWALPEDSRSDDEDLTILGDRGDQLDLREHQVDAWAAFCEEVGEPMDRPYRRISPDSGSNYSRWAIVTQLARTPGLYGLVLEDLQPFGYEGRRSEAWHSSLEKPMGEMTDFGYSPKQRLEFLRAHSLDPIDAVGDRLNLRSDLRQPYFPDGLLADPGLIQAWDAQRADAYRRSIQALLDNLPKDLPGGTLVSPGRAAINDRAGWGTLFSAPGGDDYGTVYRFNSLLKRGDLAGLYTSLSAKGPICLDFRDVRIDALASVLDRCFMQVVPIRVIKIEK